MAQTYALAFSGCPGLTVTGLSFYATTIFVYDSLDATVRAPPLPSQPPASQQARSRAPIGPLQSVLIDWNRITFWQQCQINTPSFRLLMDPKEHIVSLALRLDSHE